VAAQWRVGEWNGNAAAACRRAGGKRVTSPYVYVTPCTVMWRKSAPTWTGGVSNPLPSTIQFDA